MTVVRRCGGVGLAGGAHERAWNGSAVCPAGGRGLSLSSCTSGAGLPVFVSGGFRGLTSGSAATCASAHCVASTLAAQATRQRMQRRVRMACGAFSIGGGRCSHTGRAGPAAAGLRAAGIRGLPEVRSPRARFSARALRVLPCRAPGVAFSCKRRGFCPSCGARRMAESAALLVEEVFPEQPVRQRVLSVPYPLRFLFASCDGPIGCFCSSGRAPRPRSAGTSSACAS